MEKQLFDWKDWDEMDFGNYDWNERADETETAAINLATTLGAIIGAGAALASGFGKGNGY